ncbi:MAG: hypothetical protein R3C45_22485, partial [Phycisphaerales bacterium]
MRKMTFVKLGAAVVTASMFAGQAQAQVIYSDSFNRIAGSGDTNGKPADPNNFSAWGANDNALGGSVVNTWLVGPSRGGGANQVTDGSLASTIEGGAHYLFDATTVAPNGFQVEFDFTRFHPFNPGSGNGFLAVGLGADTGAVIGGGGFVPNNSDLTLLFQQAVAPNAGNMQILEDNVFAGGTSGTGLGPVDYGDPTIWHSVKLVLIPAVAGAYGSADTINASVSIDGGTPYNFSVLGGTEFGNLGFSSNGF